MSQNSLSNLSISFWPSYRFGRYTSSIRNIEGDLFKRIIGIAVFSVHYYISLIKRKATNGNGNGRQAFQIHPKAIYPNEHTYTYSFYINKAEFTIMYPNPNYTLHFSSLYDVGLLEKYLDYILKHEIEKRVYFNFQ